MYHLEELCLEITGKCLMNCLHCSSSCASSNQSAISFAKIKEVLHEAKVLGTKIIEISGGEPLLHPEIVNIVEEAKKDFEVRLYTSGFIGNKTLLGISRELLMVFNTIGLDRIIFNLQGATAEVHELITKTTGSFENVINSIKTSRDLGIWTGVHFVPMKPNYSELPMVAAMCRKLKVNELAVLRFVRQGRGLLNRFRLELDHSEFSDLLNTIIFLRKEFEDYFAIRTGCPLNFCSLIDRAIKPVACKAGVSTLLVSFNGKVVPCPAFKQAQDFVLGNINVDSLLSIWQNNQELEHLRKFDYRRIEGCKECDNLSYCQGRCIAQRFYRFGNIYQGPDPLCPYQKESKITCRKKISLVCAGA
jgi:radical SAM protein with 4Fe4S-binding SPASM domain